ncbi:MAG: ASCH domain-containing protein [Bacteroidota bacterium]
MKIVLSIKPEFAFKIFDGSKKFEFRKSIFKNDKVKSVVVYASSPIQQVIGEFEIEEVLNYDLKTLWNLTQEFSGITEDFYYKYFANKEEGYAIKIKNTIRYGNPKCLRTDFNLFPPQSFAYLYEK